MIASQSASSPPHPPGANTRRRGRARLGPGCLLRPARLGSAVSRRAALRRIASENSARTSGPPTGAAPFPSRAVNGTGREDFARARASRRACGAPISLNGSLAEAVRTVSRRCGPAVRAASPSPARPTARVRDARPGPGLAAGTGRPGLRVRVGRRVFARRDVSPHERGGELRRRRRVGERTSFCGAFAKDFADPEKGR